MAIFLDTRGNATLGIAICDRCKQKMPIAKLSPDRDKPGLMVCRECNDVKDPWRLPWTPADGNIALRRPRPEEPLQQVHPLYAEFGGGLGDRAVVQGATLGNTTGDIDLVIHCEATTWTPFKVYNFVVRWNKNSGPTADLSYYMILFGSEADPILPGKVRFGISTDGVDANALVDSTVGLDSVAVDGEPIWIRGTRVNSTGLTTLYTSTNGSSWAQLGASAVSNPGGVQFASGADLQIAGLYLNGYEFGWNIPGKVYFAQLRDGIDGPPIWTFDPALKGVEKSDTFVSSSEHVWTLRGNSRIVTGNA